MTPAPAPPLRRSRHWEWRLHENQATIGRVVFHLRRELHGSLARLTDAEWRDLRREIVLFEGFAAEVFAPDRFNYDQLGNVVTRLHVHGVPRYRAPRDWRGIRCVDSNWGGHWHPEPESPLGPVALARLAAWLRPRLAAYRRRAAA